MPEKNILIIDNNIDLVETIKPVLENAGFDVIHIREGHKGLKRIKKDRPDLVILNIMMEAQEEGFHIAYKIKSGKDTANIPVLILTAAGQETGFVFDKEDDEDFFSVDELIEKPIDPDELVELVKTSLGQ